MRFSSLIGLGLVLHFVFAGADSSLADEQSVERGQYIFQAAGCEGCHSKADGSLAPLAGGRELITPFGVFVSPNITPDKETGLGDWTLAEFSQALREGLGPDGSAYYPAFPYPSYSGMSDRDVADLWAYLQSLAAVRQTNEEHRLDFPFAWRFLVKAWRLMFFDGARFEPREGASAAWNRGAYLVRHLAHCGECHSPRNFLGAERRDAAMSGNPNGPDGKRVPAADAVALSDWSEEDLASLLQIGLTPEGDFMSGAMEEVIKKGTSKLTDDDRAAIAHFLLSGVK